MAFYNNVIAGAAGAGAGDSGFTIQRSLRFERADDAYLTRNFSASNRKTWTFSCWAKLSEVGTNREFFVGGGSPWLTIQIAANDKFYVSWTAGQSGTPWQSDALFRDTSAWYHFVVVFDTTQSTAANRLKVYANGVQLTGNSSYPAQDTEYQVNSAVQHGVGGWIDELSGYLADVHFIDGQALAATDFGEYDNDNVWQPKEFEGAYTSTNTSTTLTQVGWDPSTTNSGNHTFIWDGNTTNKANGYNGGSIGTVSFSPPLTGVTKVELWTQNYKHYLNGSEITTSETTNGGWHTYYDSSTAITLNSVGNAYDNYTQTVDLGAIRINGTIIDSNTWTPPSGIGVQSSGANSFYLKFADNSSNAALGTDSSGGSNTWTVNNLVAAVPGLSTANEGFGIVQYTGNQSNRSFNLGFQPDFVWIKAKAGGFNHQLFDSVRGVTKTLNSNTTSAEATAANSLTAFNSNGFSLGSDNNGDVNGGGPTNYIAWAWKAGGTASSNSDGSITSSVSANSTYGFSVVTYTGTGSNATVGHGLSSAPKWILVKDRSQATGWSVYHDAIGTSSSNYIELQDTATSSQDNTAFQNTAPTNSVFSIGTKAAVNESGDNFVAYCWSEISGFSRFGSYTGDGGTKTITTGFKPRFILIKSHDTQSNWHLLDGERGSAWLEANGDAAENTNSNIVITYTATGFTVNGGNVNNSGTGYLYMAFADKPDGTGIDSLIDTPTNYEAGSGNNGGNYATLNPLTKSSSNSLISNGNLEFDVTAGSGWVSVLANMAITTEKIYFEVTSIRTNGLTGCNASGAVVAVRRLADQANWHVNGNDNYTLRLTDMGCVRNGTVAQVQLSSGNLVEGDVTGFAIDGANGTYKIYRNGTLESSGSLSLAGYSAGDSLLPFAAGFPDGGGYTYGKFSKFNFGQRPFAHTPPTGYKSLCTTNLFDPTIADGSTAFDIATWSGAGGSGDKTITGLNLSDAPDLVWSKTRNHGYHNVLFDNVRGFGASNALITDYLGAADAGRIKSTAASSITWEESGSSRLWFDQSSKTYVAWAWDAGTVTNPVGDIWSPGASKYIGIKFATASGGTVVYGQTSGSDTVEVWTSSDNANWTQQGSSQTLSTERTLTTSDQYVYIRNTSDATFSNWYAAASNGADGHYSSATYPSGASWSGPAYTDYDFRDAGGTVKAIGSLNSSVYNQSQDWSGGSVSGATYSSVDWEDAFDGALGTGVFTYATNTSTLTMPSNTTWSNKFEVYALKHGGTLYVNGTDVGASMSGFNTTAQWHDITSIVGSSGTLSNIGVSDVGTNYVKLFAVRLDGKLLVDSGESVTNVPSIASIVRANPTAGFSIVQYTGPGSVGTIAHGLSAAPDFILAKNYQDLAGSWMTYHSGYPGGTHGFNFQATTGVYADSGYWNGTDPDSNVITLGSYTNTAHTWIVFCWSAVKGYSSFGKYTGNGSADGPFVYTGFRVKWLLTKRSDGGANDWQLIDASRSPSNVADDALKPNSSGAEGTHADYGVDFLSNGFKQRTSHIARNGSGNIYIYAAFAEHPFKTSRAV